MVGLFLIFLSAILYKVSSEIKNAVLNTVLRTLAVALAFFMAYSVVNCFSDIKSSPESETVMIVNEDGTVTEENGKYYVDDDGNYYIRTDNWKKTILLAPFEKMKFEKVNPPIFDTDNLVSEEINNKEK